MSMDSICLRKLAIFFVLIQIVSILGIFVKCSHLISHWSQSFSFGNAANATTKDGFAQDSGKYHPDVS
jgi:hypothetical protein